jgi:hypothetical protein
MDTQPKIPTLKDSQKPQVKVRGLEAGVTLFDRLKQFKKKDLAFILAGLGTLFMAPLAEHFMMSPEAGDGTLQQGWKGNGSGGGGMFNGSGSSPYEPGTTGLAPGSAVGGGSDIITPLNVRDPSALVMGPGATQQPPTNSVMPSTPPPTAPASHSDSDLKDALAASARGVGAAAHAAKALLPIPHVALAGNSLRGLSAVSGGSSANAGGPISSAGLVTGKANTGGGGLNNVRASSNYKGVARGATGGDTTGMDALKKAAGDASGSFNRGSANAGLNDAANTAIPAGGGGALGGGGAGGVGSTDKPFGGDQNKDGKNIGESLAFLKQKAIQDAQIALWTKEQEADDSKLEMLKMRNTMLDAVAGKLGGSLGDLISCPVTPGKGGFKGCWGSGGATMYMCVDGGSVRTVPVGDVSTDGHCSGGMSGGNSTAGKLWTVSGDGATLSGCATETQGQKLTGCKTDGSAPAAKTAQQQGSVEGLNDIQKDGNIASLDSICTSATKNKADLLKVSPKNAASITTFYDGIKTQTANLIAARDAMFKGKSGDADCGTVTPIETKSYASALDAATQARDLTAGKAGDDAAKTPNAIAEMKGVVAKSDKPLDDKGLAAAGADDLKKAESARADAFTILTKSLAAINGVVPPAVPADWTDKSEKTQGLILSQQITNAQTGLRSYQSQLAGILDPAAPLATQQKVLDQVVGTGSPAGSTLKDVVQTNVDAAKVEKDYHAAAKDGDGASVKPADADSKAQAPGTDISGTQAAIKTAQASVGKDGTGAAASVKKYADLPEDVAPATAKAQAKVQAQTDLGTAKRDVAQMQATQSGMLDSTAKTIQCITLPAGTAAPAASN